VDIQLPVCSVVFHHSLGWGYEAMYTNQTVPVFDRIVPPSFPQDLTWAMWELLLLQFQTELRYAEPTLLYINWKQRKMHAVLLAITYITRIRWGFNYCCQATWFSNNVLDLCLQGSWFELTWVTDCPERFPWGLSLQVNAMIVFFKQPWLLPFELLPTHHYRYLPFSFDAV